MVLDQNYVLRETETDAESTRLALLENCFDPSTVRRLEDLKIAPGARCLEVGAGRGSIARWLSEKVGPDGTVVAVDIDCRFLSDMPDNIEVRELDVRDDDLETDTYDFVHCRLLLGHLPDPAVAARKMASSLCPGGVLLAEELDDRMVRYHGHPDAAWATEQWRRQFGGMRAAKIANVSLGGELPDLFLHVGLQLAGCEFDVQLLRSGDPLYEWYRLTRDALAAPSIAAGFCTEDDHARVMTMMQSPATALMPAAVVATWARRARHENA